MSKNKIMKKETSKITNRVDWIEPDLLAHELHKKLSQIAI
jgi:hypothetical protein